MQLPIPAFKVLLYGPDLPPAGMRARAHFEDSVLVVQGKGHWFTVLGDRLILETGGFDGRQWLLSWSNPSGIMTAMLQGDDALEAFIKLAPPLISSELRKVHRAYGDRARKLLPGMGWLAAVVFMSVVACGMFWIYEDVVSEWSAHRGPLARIFHEYPRALAGPLSAQESFPQSGV